MSMRTTRRNVLVVGAGLLSADLRGGLATAAEADWSLELFAFRSLASQRAVFAIVCCASSDDFALADQAMREVTIHAGPFRWTLEGLQAMRPEAAVARSDGRWFVGEVVGAHPTRDETYHAIVLEARPGALAIGEIHAVWAELRTVAGARLRVGSPLAAELLARSRQLASCYHRTSPDGDLARFMPVLTASIAKRDGMAGRAHQLALRLLPDVIAYRHDLPVGFTFATQNGRHPSDNTAAVVATVLAGTVQPTARSPSFVLEADFPYFRRPDLPV